MLKSSNSFAHKTLYWICSASNRGFPASAFTEFKIQNWCFFPAICSKGWKVKVVGSLRKGASIICNLLLLHIWQFLYCSRICWLSERDLLLIYLAVFIIKLFPVEFVGSLKERYSLTFCFIFGSFYIPVGFVGSPKEISLNPLLI